VDEHDDERWRRGEDDPTSDATDGAPDPSGAEEPAPAPADEDDLEGFETPLLRLARRVRGWIALVVAIALAIPLGSWLVDELAFRSSGGAVAEQLGDDAALADALLLVRATGCDGRVSTGSAFALAVQGTNVVITNRHVVEAAARVGVRPLDGGPAIAVREHRISPSADVAVLELTDPAEIPPALARGGPARVGDTVRVVGFPGGQPAVDEGTIATADAQDMVIDLPTLPGTSGSPVLDGDGAVVGQVFARTSDGQGVATSLERLLGAVADARPAPGC
jgi:S1-C subfamily serine protease